MNEANIGKDGTKALELSAAISDLSIQPIPTSRTDLAAFRIVGTVTRNDMQFMGAVVNRVLGLRDIIDMLLVFEDNFSVVPGANLSMTAIKAELRAVRQVRRYATVGAPTLAAAMIRTVGAMLNLDARTFTRETEADAWDWMQASQATRDARVTLQEWETMAAVNERAHLAQGEEGRSGIAAAILHEGRVVAFGANEVHRQCDATRHAEMVAMDIAAETIGKSDLSGCTLLSSLQPCEMCLAAARFSGIDRIIFAATKANVAAKYFVFPGLELQDFHSASSKAFTVIGGIQEEAMLPLYRSGAA